MFFMGDVAKPFFLKETYVGLAFAAKLLNL